MLSDEEWGALLGEEQRARWAAEQDCQHYRERAEELAEAEAGAAVMRQALEALLDWGGWRHCGCGWCLRCRVVKPALATAAGRVHLEADAKREALGRKLAAITNEMRSACRGDLEDCLACFHVHRCRRADAALAEAHAAGWLEGEDNS